MGSIDFDWGSAIIYEFRASRKDKKTAWDESRGYKGHARLAGFRVRS